MSQKTSNYELSDAEKIEAFDMIAERVYHRNFGRLSKSDFDVLMFSIYLEHCFKDKLPTDDHTLAVNLGITEAKVRSLKVNKELLYPREHFEWKTEFCNCIANARYNDSKYVVVVPIPDPNVRREIEAYIDQKGWYNEYQLNTKLLQMRADQFIELCIDIAKEENNLKEEIDPHKLAMRLQSEKASLMLEPETFAGEWDTFGPKKALSGVLRKASGAIVKTVLSEIPFVNMFDEAINSFINNILD